MPHYVRPIIDGDRIRLKFECDEPIGARCKIDCGEHDCDMVDVEWRDGKPFHIAYDIGESDYLLLHEMVPSDSCTILEWDDLDEGYCGERTELRSGKIEFIWEGDFYTWKYAEDPATPSAEAMDRSEAAWS